MSAGPSSQSAVSLIRKYLSAHDFLSTTQMFKLGTEGLKPVLQPATALNPQGGLRMKFVANAREGKAIWRPPPSAPYPHHPFKSVGFLKSHILAGLEAQQLIRKTFRLRPAQTEQERDEAVAMARRMNIRIKRAAEQKKQMVERLVEPDFSVKEFGWELVKPGDVGTEEVEEGSHSDVSSISYSSRYSAGSSKSSTSSSKGRVPSRTLEEVARAWRRAEEIERGERERDALIQEDIAKRKAARSEWHKQEKVKTREKKQELVRTGEWEYMKEVAKIEEAKKDIRKYAEDTGEDVSEWFKELDLRSAQNEERFAALNWNETEVEPDFGDDESTTKDHSGRPFGLKKRNGGKNSQSSQESYL